MRSNEQEAGYLNVRQRIAAAERQREIHLESALKRSSAARAGSSGLALLFLACVAYVAVDGSDYAGPAAYSKIASAVVVSASTAYGEAASPGREAFPAANTLASARVGNAESNSDRDGNVMTYEHD